MQGNTTKRSIVTILAAGAILTGVSVGTASADSYTGPTSSTSVSITQPTLSPTSVPTSTPTGTGATTDGYGSGV